MAPHSWLAKVLKARFSARALFLGMLLAFLLAAGFTAYLTFIAVRQLAYSWSETRAPEALLPPLGPLPTIIPTPEPITLDANLPLQPVGGPTPAPWDSSTRLNVLVLGLDTRAWQTEEAAPRSDAMLLLSLDTATQTGGILSIPRDLWVSIPGGFEPNRINLAYQIGELHQLPGGGAGLAMRTVEKLLDMPVHYYVVVDFQAFTRLIDEIGGVKIAIAEPIRIDPLGKKLPRTLEPGVQVLPGELALAYARASNGPGADFDRAEHQQQVLFGIRNRLLSQDLLSRLIRRAPLLYSELSAGLRSNLNLLQVIQLAWLARQIPEENIKRGLIGPDQVAIETAEDGQEILRPQTEPLRRLRDELFTDSGPIAPTTATADLHTLLTTEAARVSVLNGTQSPGLASQTADYLFSFGIEVKKVGNASELYSHTTIIDYTGKPNTVKQLLELLGSRPDQVFHRYDASAGIDILVLLGQDWADNNPLP
jgi:LCP family protein required for cell wall assembly